MSATARRTADIRKAAELVREFARNGLESGAVADALALADRLDPAGANGPRTYRGTWDAPATYLDGRKRHKRVEQEAIRVFVTERGSATLDELAVHFDIAPDTARRHADGLVDQGKLTVAPGRPGGRALRRYGAP